MSVLLFGENSLSVLQKVEREKRQLLAEKGELQRQNQRLQKQYFELLQITGE